MIYIINLKIFDNNIDYDEVSLSQVVGDIDVLTGTLKQKKIDIQDKISIVDKNRIIFEGEVVKLEKKLNGEVSFTAYDLSWNLRRKTTLIKSYNGWRIDDIFNGISESDINNISFNSKFIEAVWISNNDTGKNLIITGKIGNSKITENIKLEETDNRKRSKSIWNLEEKPYTWSEILSVHLENDNGRIIFPNNIIYLKDSEGNILAQINRDRHIAAKKDNFGHYSNGILYETEIILNLDLPDEIKNNAIFIVSGENILGYLRELCSGSYFMWGTTIPYQLDFKLDGNILTIKDIKDEIIHVFREDREILGASYSISIENISNYITFTTKDKVIIMIDQDSINKYGIFEYYDEGDFYDAESDYYAANLLRDLGSENEEIDCNIIGLFPEIGSKVRVIIPSFGLDNEYIIQETKIRIGPNGYGNSSLTLSKKKINRRWTIPFKNVMEINKIKLLVKRRRG